VHNTADRKLTYSTAIHQKPEQGNRRYQTPPLVQCCPLVSWFEHMPPYQIRAATCQVSLSIWLFRVATFQFCGRRNVFPWYGLYCAGNTSRVDVQSDWPGGQDDSDITTYTHSDSQEAAPTRSLQVTLLEPHDNLYSEYFIYLLARTL